MGSPTRCASAGVHAVHIGCSLSRMALVMGGGTVKQPPVEVEVHVLVVKCEAGEG